MSEHAECLLRMGVHQNSTVFAYMWQCQQVNFITLWHSTTFLPLLLSVISIDSIACFLINWRLCIHMWIFKIVGCLENIYSPNDVMLPGWKTTLTSGMYGLFTVIINANATANKHEPNRSPSAVKIGIAELSGSILYFHITCIITCAMYNSVQI